MPSVATARWRLHNKGKNNEEQTEKTDKDKESGPPTKVPRVEEKQSSNASGSGSQGPPPPGFVRSTSGKRNHDETKGTEKGTEKGTAKGDGKRNDRQDEGEKGDNKAAPQRRRRKAGNEGDEQVTYTDHLQVLYKATLNSMQTQRQHGAVLATTYLLPTQEAPVQAALGAGADYDRHCKEGEAPAGAPHMHISLAFLESLSAAGTLKHTAEGRILHKLTLAFADADTPEMIGQVLPTFRVKECYKRPGAEALTKVEFAVHPLPLLPRNIIDDLEGMEGPLLAQTIRMAISQAMEQHQGKLKLGAAPRGELERVAQRQLRALQRQ